MLLAPSKKINISDDFQDHFQTFDQTSNVYHQPMDYSQMIKMSFLQHEQSQDRTSMRPIHFNKQMLLIVQLWSDLKPDIGVTENF